MCTAPQASIQATRKAKSNIDCTMGPPDFKLASRSSKFASARKILDPSQEVCASYVGTSLLVQRQRKAARERQGEGENQF